MEKLLEEFREIEAAYIKKGLTQKQIKSELLQHVRGRKAKNDGPGRSTKYKTFILYTCPVIFAVLLGCAFMYKDDIVETVKTTKCLVEQNVMLSEISRPMMDCSKCANIKSVPIVRNISKEEFTEKYAYTAVPVLIKEATQNWTAMDTFSYEYFKRIYTEKEDTLRLIDEDCQFFGYKTEFDSLEEALNMSKERADYKDGEQPWYFGW